MIFPLGCLLTEKMTLFFLPFDEKVHGSYVHSVVSFHSLNWNPHLWYFNLHCGQKHVADFYISDFQSGLRALVKTGHGARVTPYVDESIVVDINQNNRDLSPEFVRWLGERNLSSDDRVMRIKEG